MNHNNIESISETISRIFGEDPVRICHRVRSQCLGIQINDGIPVQIDAEMKKKADAESKEDTLLKLLKGGGTNVTLDKNMKQEKRKFIGKNGDITITSRKKSRKEKVY